MGFQFKKNNNIEYGVFTEFYDNSITAAVSFRKGGISLTPFDSLNLGLHTEDESDKVILNRKKFFEILNINYKDVVALKQIHSDKVVVVNNEDKGRGSISYEDSLDEADAMVTKHAGIPLVIFTADCMSVFFMDPIKRVIGIAHSGWKGTYYNITSKVVDNMIKLGAEKANIITAFGPSIGVCCYEVGKEMLEKFNYKFIENKNKKYYLNLNKANKYNLISAGLKKENILDSNYCTACNIDNCYSYREENKTGRLGSVIML